MKRIVFAILALGAAFQAFSEDIFRGRSFEEMLNRDTTYAFNESNEIALLDPGAGGEKYAVLNYELSEKKGTVTIWPKLLRADVFSAVDGADSDGGAELVGYDTIVKRTNDKSFSERLINTQVLSPLGIDEGVFKIDIESKKCADELLNFAFFISTAEGMENPSTFDKNINYEEKFKKVTEAEFNQNEGAKGDGIDFEQMYGEAVSGMRQNVEQIIARAKSTPALIRQMANTAFNSKATFKYERREDGQIWLEETAETLTPFTVFHSVEAHEIFGNEMAILQSGMVAVQSNDAQRGEGPKLYTTSDKIKKSSGKLTFRNTDNQKDKLSAKYKIDADGENATLTLSFTSGILKGKELKGEYALSKALLKESK